jgi:Class II Aldolase and Adducin N-terminal domain
MVAHFGRDDLVFTHFSARVPGPEHHFLLNPYNLRFDEITASSLVKVDLEGNAVALGSGPVNPPRPSTSCWQTSMPKVLRQPVESAQYDSIKYGERPAEAVVGEAIRRSS